MSDALRRVLFVGDVIGGAGRRCLQQLLAAHPADVVIVNGENAAAGLGITPKLYADLRELGADVVTTGNHVWHRKEIVPLLQAGEERLLRPANYPPGAVGRGWTVFDKAGLRVAVINLLGRAFMEPCDCPLQTLDRILLDPAVAAAPVKIVDYHAEATAEKGMLAWYADGRVSAVIGTHTHVQTADERLLPRGTAFITDVGMTGPRDSIIGIKPEQPLHRALTGMPVKYEVAEGPCVFNGLLLAVDAATGRVRELQRLNEEYAAQGG